MVWLSNGGDKVEPATKEQVEAAVKDVRATLDSGSLDEVKAKTEALTTAMTAASQQIYAQAQSEAQAAPNGAGEDGGPSAAADDEEVVDAEVVDEDK